MKMSRCHHESRHVAVNVTIIDSGSFTRYIISISELKIDHPSELFNKDYTCVHVPRVPCVSTYCHQKNVTQFVLIVTVGKCMPQPRRDNSGHEKHS